MIQKKIMEAIKLFRNAQIKRRGLAQSLDGEEYAYVLIDDLLDCVSEVETLLGIFSFLGLDGDVMRLTVFDSESEEKLVIEKQIPHEVFEKLNDKNLTVEYLSLESRVMRSMYRNLYKITGLIEGQEEKESFLKEDFKEEVKKNKKSRKKEEVKDKSEPEAEEESSSDPSPEAIEPLKVEEPAEEISTADEDETSKTSKPSPKAKEAMMDNIEFNLENLLYDSTEDEIMPLEKTKESKASDGIEDLLYSSEDDDAPAAEETPATEADSPSSDDASSEESEKEREDASIERDARIHELKEDIIDRCADFIQREAISDEDGLELYSLVMNKLFKKPQGLIDLELESLPPLVLEKLHQSIDEKLHEIKEEYESETDKVKAQEA